MKKIFPLILAGLLLIVSSVYAGDLENVMNEGVLRFGVLSERSPFVFYDENDELTGIDIKLMEEAANRTPGVKEAVVNFMLLKMNVEFEDGADPKAVMQEVLKNCKKVESDCEIFLK